MPRSKTPTTNLEEAKARFGEWRQNRRGKARIPADLWLAAVAVAEKEGLNRTARELQVAWDDLKRRMSAPSTSLHVDAPIVRLRMRSWISGAFQWLQLGERNAPWLLDRENVDDEVYFEAAK